MDNVIDVEHLSKQFRGRPAVVDVSLQVRQAEIFGFLGPNGSGKTTTIRMLCGLLTPDQGRGTCLGYDIIQQAAEIKLQIGYMTQQFSLYEELTVYENLEFIARVYHLNHRRERIEHTIQSLGMTQRRSQLAGELSGGWKQRLALSATLLHQPKLLLLDEPTAGVDPAARRQFWDEISFLSMKGMTTLVSTHSIDEAQRCHRLAYIANGKLLTTGTPSEIVKQSQLTVWSVTGKHLNQLAAQLRHLPGIEQVNYLGERVQVCGRDAKALSGSVQSIQSTEWQCEQVAPNLEEALINLVQSHQVADQDERFHAN